MPYNVQCKKCLHYRNQWCEQKLDSPDPDLVRDCQYYRGMTNADRIRAMSDVELVGGMINIMQGWCPLPSSQCKSTCKECLLEWLKQEVET